jgi:hypothetical protein
MTAFTELELAALHSIFSETPELAPELERQLTVAMVSERENSGAGFFTTIAIPDDAARVSGPRVLGYETQARVAGLEHGLGFVLVVRDGRLDLLEGYCRGPETTAALDLTALTFEVFREPAQRAGPARPERRSQAPLD